MDPAHRLGATIHSTIDNRHSTIRIDALLFGESAGRIVVSCEPHRVEALEHLASRVGVPVATIGRVGGSRLSIEPWINAPVEELSEVWRTGLENAQGSTLKAQG